MRVLVAYSSKTGSTEKVAKVIHQYNLEWDSLNLADKELVEKVDLDSYDVIFVGGWIDKGTYNKECLDFVNTLTHKEVAFFFTLGAYPTSKHAYDCIKNITAVLENNHNHVLNHFHCQGAIDGKLMNWMKSLPAGHGHAPDVHRLKRWENAAKHPNEEDFDAAANFVDFTMRSYMKEREQ